MDTELQWAEQSLGCHGSWEFKSEAQSFTTTQASDASTDGSASVVELQRIQWAQLTAESVDEI